MLLFFWVMLNYRMKNKDVKQTTSGNFLTCRVCKYDFSTQLEIPQCDNQPKQFILLKLRLQGRRSSATSPLGVCEQERSRLL